jgi:outer membrane protein assembly factor BamB
MSNRVATLLASASGTDLWRLLDEYCPLSSKFRRRNTPRLHEICSNGLQRKTPHSNQLGRAALLTLTVLSLGLMLGAPATGRSEDWPRFRGPTGQGHSSETGLPVSWSTTENILWKSPVAGASWSSPIVLGDQVFLTTTTNEGRDCHVLSLDLHSGQLLWDTVVLQQVPRRKEQKNSYASSTPCTDGERVYACFADGSLVAVSLKGELLWTNRDFPFYSKHGLGASPIVYQGLVIMPFDGSSDGPDPAIGWQKPWDQAQVVALHADTGKLAWKTRRGLSRVSHMTPLILPIDGVDQLISPAGDRIQGFAPLTGALLWTIDSQGEGVTPSPVAAAGKLFTSSGFEATTLRTIKLGGAEGNATSSHIVWEQKKGVPTQASLIVVDDLLYAVTDNGVATAYRTTDGEVVWQERLGGTYSASPVYADGKLYFLSEQGQTTVVKPNATFEVLSRNPLEEAAQASPAVASGRIVIRTEHHLWAIGTPAAR